MIVSRDIINLRILFLFLFLGFVIFLQFVPLTNILGYEFSIIIGLLQFIICGYVAITQIKNCSEKSCSALNTFKKAKYYLLAVAIFPLLISFINTLVFVQCPLEEGLFYYIILALPSAICGFLLGYAIAVTISKFQYLIFTLIVLLIVCVPVVEIYFNPQIYFYSPLFGFFPGTIYDENIPLDFKLISYRILNFSFFLILAFSANKLRSYSIGKKILGFSSIIVVCVMFYFLKPIVGFATNESRIKNELKRELNTENFKIIYNDSVKKEWINIVALHHEYFFESLKNLLKTQPSEMITSFIFKDSEQKRKLFGAEQADVAKPWLNQIYIELNNYDQSLKHELAHVFSAQNGVTPFKIADGFNPAMIEGLAMAIENNYNDHSLYYMASLANNSGNEFEIEQLFSGFNFFSKLSSVAYIHSGAFIYFLIEKYGIEKVKSVYGDIDFPKYFDKTLTQLQAEYYDFLNSKKFNYGTEEATFLFGRKPIFKKICARYVANRLKEAWQLYREKNYKESKIEFEKLLGYSDSYSSLVGYTYSLIHLDSAKSALDTLKNSIAKFRESSYYYNLELILGGLLIRNNYFNSADSVYEELILQNPGISYTSVAATNRLFLKTNHNIANRYVTSKDTVKFDLLFELNKDNFSFDCVSSFVAVVKTNRTLYDSLLTIIPIGIVENNYSTGYGYFTMSKLAVLNGDFHNAQKFAIMSLEYAGDESYRIIRVENLKMINWFINFGEEIKSHFVYN